MSVLRRCSGENTLILPKRSNLNATLLALVYHPVLYPVRYGRKEGMGKIKEARRNPEARADALNLGLSVYALIVCTGLMILMMLGVVG